MTTSAWFFSGPSEAVAIKRALEPLEKEAAEKNRLATIARDESGQFTVSADSADTVPTQKHGGEARNKVATAIGIGHTKLYEAGAPIGRLVGFQ